MAWVPEFRRAMLRNVESPGFRAMVFALPDDPRVELTRELRQTRYHFAAGQRILPWAHARARGWAACGDGTAAAAAAALILGDGDNASVCLEEVPHEDPSYAHVRLHWQRGVSLWEVDPWPENSFQTPSCAARATVSALAGPDWRDAFRAG